MKFAVKKRKVSKKVPEFKSHNVNQRNRLKNKSWRKPKGLHSKIRKRKKYRQHLVEPGFGIPKKLKFFHPSGFKEVLVSNLNELRDVDKSFIVRVKKTVGIKKRLMLLEEAKKLGLKIINADEKVMKEKIHKLRELRKERSLKKDELKKKREEEFKKREKEKKKKEEEAKKKTEEAGGEEESKKVSKSEKKAGMEVSKFDKKAGGL